MDSPDARREGPARRRSRIAIAVALLGLTTVGAWLAWGPRPGTRESASGSASSEAADAGPGGLLAAPNRPRREAGAADRATGGAGSGAGPASRPLPKSPGPTWIVGEVVDEKGMPMPWARVGVHATMTWRVGGKDRTTLTRQGMLKADADGRFWWNGYVPAYDFWLLVEDDRAFTSEAVLAKTGGEPVRLVALRRKTALIRVEDAKGHLLSGASVTVRPVVPLDTTEWTLAGLEADDWPSAVATADATELRTVTDDAGVARCPLPAGRVHVSLDVAPPIDRDDLLPTHLQPWVPTDEATVRLLVGLPVSGRVVDSKGQPSLSGVVRWTPEHGTTFEAKIAYDGTFDVPPQPPGPIRLEAVDERLLRPKEPRPTVVAAGASGVVLVLDTASELSIRVSNRAKGAGGTACLSVDGKDGASRGTTIVDLENDGTAVLRGLLDDETYVLWVPSVELDAPPTQDGTPSAIRTGFVYRRGITLRDSPLLVEEVAGEPVELEIDSANSWFAQTVSIDERGVRCAAGCAFVGPYRNPTDAKYFIRQQARLPPLPPGEWTVRIVGTDMREDETKPVSVDVTVNAGAKVHVDFAPPDERPK